MNKIYPKNILNKHKIRPFKGLGQNFLIDKAALNKIIRVADIKPTDIILEIGPGLGVLTQELAKKVHPVKLPFGHPASRGFNRAGNVIAVEKDPKMVEILKENLKDYKNLEIIQGDILKTEPKSYNLKAKSYKLVANLPYYITSPVIRKFLESERPPELMVLMVQKEVAQRICTLPPKMNLLAVSVQFYAKPEIISYVSKKSFWPQPKVDSAIIKISNIKKQKAKIDTDLFFRIVRAGFSQPRKQLANNLSKVLKLNKPQIKEWLLKNKINPEQRAESLSVSDWKRLANSM